MSRTILYALTPGQKEIREIAVFSNSWRSGPVVWQALSRRYLGGDFGLRHGDEEELCRLADDQRLAFYERAVLMMTFDLAYVRRDNFRRAASDIRSFGLAFEAIATSHWPAIAEFLQESGAEAVGLHLTSVSENLWQGNWNEEREEPEGVDWESTFEVYDALPHSPEEANDG